MAHERRKKCKPAQLHPIPVESDLGRWIFAQSAQTRPPEPQLADFGLQLQFNNTN
jgi:hypothetical protein